MTIDHFSAAFELLDADDQKNVRAWLEAWSSAGGDVGQLAANVRAEAHLPDDQFQSLLRMCGAKFAASSALSVDEFGFFCRGFVQKGPEMDAKLRPAKLGRIEPLLKCADRCARHITDLDAKSVGEYRSELETHCSLHGRKIDLNSEVSASDPSAVVWGTFPVGGAEPLFSPPLDDFEHAVIALGMGKFWNRTTGWNLRPGTKLMFLRYAPPQGAPLLVPTVGDAEDYIYFRPAQRPDDGSSAPHGWTEPLDVRDGIVPQPEVVHQDCVWIIPR